MVGSLPAHGTPREQWECSYTGHRPKNWSSGRYLGNHVEMFHTNCMAWIRLNLEFDGGVLEVVPERDQRLVRARGTYFAESFCSVSEDVVHVYAPHCRGLPLAVFILLFSWYHVATCRLDGLGPTDDGELSVWLVFAHSVWRRLTILTQPRTLGSVQFLVECPSTGQATRRVLLEFECLSLVLRL